MAAMGELFGHTGPRDLSPEMRRLAAERLDDDISDLFGPGLGLGPGMPRTVPGTRFVNPPHILALAAEMELARKAEAREAAAETRRIRAAERKAAKAAEDEANGVVAKPKRVRRPKAAPAATPEPEPVIVKRVVTMRDIPARVTGMAVITGTIAASTGEAVVVDVEGVNNVARGIVVWHGYAQTILRQLVASGSRVSIDVAQPANDRFKPSARAVRAA